MGTLLDIFALCYDRVNEFLPDADIIEVERVRGILERQGERFLHRVFTDEERAYCSRMTHPHKHYAARFAAKEAVGKALAAPR